MTDMLPLRARVAISAMLAATFTTTALANDVPRVFVEVPQSIQYDGEYSPPAGRKAPPEASPFTPVRRPKPWEKDIPIIVKPAPRYVDEMAPSEDSSQPDAAEKTDTSATGGMAGQVKDMLSGGLKASGLGNIGSSLGTGEGADAGSGTASPRSGGKVDPGSATGSKATVNYSTVPGMAQ